MRSNASKIHILADGLFFNMLYTVYNPEIPAPAII